MATVQPQSIMSCLEDTAGEVRGTSFAVHCYGVAYGDRHGDEEQFWMLARLTHVARTLDALWQRLNNEAARAELEALWDARASARLEAMAHARKEN